MSRLAVFFPGIGYTADKPLLYYSRRLAAQLGYDIKVLSFSGFPSNVRGEAEKMRECFNIARYQSVEQLFKTDLESYSEIVFISKSIGTAAAVEYASESPAKSHIRHILYTPLEETFKFDISSAIVFTGSEDPWVGKGAIPELCKEKGLPCTVVPNANHSLETGDALADIQNLKEIIDKIKPFASIKR